jgi:hypothetical protein
VPAADPLAQPPAPYSAAWIPANDAARPWDPTPAAVRWLLEQAERLQLKSVLLCDRPMTGRLPPALRYLRQRAAWEMRRPATGRAVLVYLPSLATAARAFRVAEGGAVAVVEAPELQLAAWAAEAKAVNLLAGGAQPALPPETVEPLHRLLDSVDDGWLTSSQEDAARTVLKAARAPLSADDVAGYLLAHGCGARTVRQVVKLARDVHDPTGGPRSGCGVPS